MNWLYKKNEKFAIFRRFKIKKKINRKGIDKTESMYYNTDNKKQEDKILGGQSDGMLNWQSKISETNFINMKEEIKMKGRDP